MATVKPILREDDYEDALAQRLGIHPAVVAGRVRYERDNYRLLSRFVGTGQVRRHFKQMQHTAL